MNKISKFKLDRFFQEGGAKEKRRARVLIKRISKWNGGFLTGKKESSD